MASSSGFTTSSHGHFDNVLAVHVNYFGLRKVTGSSDHRIHVYDRKDANDSWSLTEKWRAHDAEVTDVKWNAPFMGEVLGSIGEDGRCKIWQEDPTEQVNSGRRFKLIANIGSPTHMPFMCLDFKNIDHETWLGVITRDGRLIVYEPADQGNLNDWGIMAEQWVCSNNPPDRTEEVGFKVAFHQEKLPCWTAVKAGLDRRSISMAVAAMRNVLIYRTDKARKFYLAAELKGARDIIRDVAWAGGSMRGTDIIATASKDGTIRIYEISIPQPNKPAAAGGVSPEGPAADPSAASPRAGGQKKNAPSGIGAGLAGASKLPEAHREHDVPGRVTHVVRMVDEIVGAHGGAVSRVAFSQLGDLLVTAGDDGVVRSWKKAADDHWKEYAEINAAVE
ncbi:WD40 repeat-like protein [Delitschia confertaspora ATCC 74209]|uniref:WD40 repeat-like protein n=1 Tax=Delitschia confertaspora ATCC 74209 TaxID=1513339 RepID=A0A9P4JB79_9PLEO|nr:WD40 repeat-like protein [Delitschia confertaspora ATCC 74209]